MPGFPRNTANLERVGEEEEFCWTNGGLDGGLVVSFMGLMTEPGSQPESKHMTQPQGPHSPEQCRIPGNGRERS